MYWPKKKVNADGSIKFISNKQLYDKTNINRIDNSIVKICRNYHAKSSLVENDLIKTFYYYNALYFEKAMVSGFLPPEAFVHLDKEKLIQNSQHIPIIYHKDRRATNKFTSREYAVPRKDTDDKYCSKGIISGYYWWL